MAISQARLRLQIDLLLSHYDKTIADAFRQSINNILSTVTLKVLIERLASGDVEGAWKAVNINNDAFVPLEDAIEQAYRASGILGQQAFPVNVAFYFNPRNPRAENWVRNHSSQLITEIVEDQRQSVKNRIEQALRGGENPRQAALDIVGRVNRANGNREGGIIGLTFRQSGYVNNAFLELSSGDPELMKAYLKRQARDKRFDKTIIKAINEGSKLPRNIIDNATNNYANRLLRLRGETVGRTESLSSINGAQDEAFRQGLEKTNYGEEDVIKEWDSAGDGRVRHTHSVLDGQKVLGLDTPFQSPSGALLRFPGDRSLGAGANEIVACRCRCKRRIDFFREMRNEQ